MFLCQLDDHTAQTQQRDQVGDRHEAVEGIGDIPDKIQLQGGADHHHDNEQALVNANTPTLQQELKAPGSVQGPAQNGGQGKEGNAHSHHHGAQPGAEHRAEGGGDQLRACALAPLDGDALLDTAQNRQRRQGADDDGVHKDLENAVHTLLHRIALGGGSVSHGRRAETSLIGEHTAANTLLDGGHDGDAKGTAQGGLCGEGTLEDHGKNLADAAQIGQHHRQGCQNVDRRHHGNQFLCHRADALDAAKEHHRHHSRHNRTDHDAADGHDLTEHRHGVRHRITTEGIDGRIDGGSNGIDLGHVANAESRQRTQHTEHTCQPIPAFTQTISDIIHRQLILLFVVQRRIFELLVLNYQDCQNCFAI